MTGAACAFGGKASCSSRKAIRSSASAVRLRSTCSSTRVIGERKPGIFPGDLLNLRQAAVDGVELGAAHDHLDFPGRLGMDEIGAREIEGKQLQAAVGPLADDDRRDDARLPLGLIGPGHAEAHDAADFHHFLPKRQASRFISLARRPAGPWSIRATVAPRAVGRPSITPLPVRLILSPGRPSTSRPSRPAPGAGYWSPMATWPPISRAPRAGWETGRPCISRSWSGGWPLPGAVESTDSAVIVSRTGSSSTTVTVSPMFRVSGAGWSAQISSFT